MNAKFIKLSEHQRGGYWLAVENARPIHLNDITELADLSMVRRKLAAVTQLHLPVGQQSWADFVIRGLLAGIAKRGVGDFDFERASDERQATPEDNSRDWEKKLANLRRQLEQFEPGDPEHAQLTRELFWAERSAKNGAVPV